MQEKDIEKILTFLREARKMHQTYRFTPQPDGRNENIAEHSYSVALTCMLLASRLEKEFDVKLDTEKILKMAIIHDIAEVKTGDTATWDTEARTNKEENERMAIQELVALLPSDLGEEILMFWEECEARETLEAKIVKSIDRFDPVLHRTFFGLGWDNVTGGHETLEALDDRQFSRHEFSKTLTEIYEALRKEAISNNLL